MPPVKRSASCAFGVASRTPVTGCCPRGGIPRERCDQRHLPAVDSGKERGEGRAARAHSRGRLIDHGKWPFGGQALDASLPVAVQERVTHDHQSPAHHWTSRITGWAVETPAAISTAAQRRCTTTRCPSWTVAVAEDSMQTASSASLESGLGCGPVRAQTVMSHSCAARAALRTLRLLPEVLIEISTSPARPWACTWRAKAYSAP